MSVSKNNQLLSADIKFNDLSNIKEFINSANSRLDSITSITKNSHAIAADAVRSRGLGDVYKRQIVSR